VGIVLFYITNIAKPAMNNSSSSSDFLLWGSKAGIATFVLQDLIEFAATPQQFRYAINEMLPPPPIYPVDEIRAMHDKDPMGISPKKADFLVIGTCPNGDPIAVDISQEPGSVWYLSHEQIFDKAPRSVAVKVAANIPSFHQALSAEKSFPRDYWDAV
jgi:hypothetical protein